MVYHAPEVQEEGLLHHVTLQVVDIERSLGFYGAIGFTISEKFMQMVRDFVVYTVCTEGWSRIFHECANNLFEQSTALLSATFIQGCRSCYIEGLGTRIKLEELPPRRESFRRSQPAPHGATSKIVFDVTKVCRKKA